MVSAALYRAFPSSVLSPYPSMVAPLAYPISTLSLLRLMTGARPSCSINETSYSLPLKLALPVVVMVSVSASYSQSSNFTSHSSIIVTCFQLSAISYRTNPALPIPYPVEVVLARGQPAVRRASIFNARTRYTGERVSVRGRFHAPARFHGHAAALQFVLPVPFSGQLKT